MTACNILQAMNGLPEQFIEEAEQDTLPKPKAIWAIGAATAACLCIVAAAVIGLPLISDKEPALITPGNSIGDIYIAGSLARAPYPGEVWYNMYLDSDMQKRGDELDDVVYWVEIIFSNEEIVGNANMHRNLVAPECQRLASLGYELYTKELDWTGYWGEPKHFTTVCGILSAEQMEALAENSQYGCYIDFGKGSPEEYVRVTP